MPVTGSSFSLLHRGRRDTRCRDTGARSHRAGPIRPGGSRVLVLRGAPGASSGRRRLARGSAMERDGLAHASPGPTGRQADGSSAPRPRPSRWTQTHGGSFIHGTSGHEARSGLRPRRSSGQDSARRPRFPDELHGITGAMDPTGSCEQPHDRSNHSSEHHQEISMEKINSVAVVGAGYMEDYS